MVTNWFDIFDFVLLCVGCLDCKIEILLLNEVGWFEIFKIYVLGVVVDGDFDFESVVKMSDGFNGVDFWNVVIEVWVYFVLLELYYVL